MKNVRSYCFECLYNVLYKGAFTNIEIDKILRREQINELDKKLFTKIVYGTLQNLSSLTYFANHLSEKEVKFEGKVLIAMSLYQLIYLDKIPPFAIINEANEIAKDLKGDFFAKYVNAILREAQRRLPLTVNPDDFKDIYYYYSTIYNTPVWVIKMWENHYGKERTMDILKSNIMEAPLTIRVNDPSIIDSLSSDFIKGNLSVNSYIYVGETPIMETELFKEHKISIQDESSQYVVDILEPQENERILDMCAAPGSKTSYIAKRMNNTGKILAVDIHEHRVELLKKYLHSLEITNTMCVCYDSTKISANKKLVGSFDKVLLDAPCLGLGVIRRKPDVLFDLKPDKLDEIVSLQEKLLDQAYLMLKKGGVLVYSTCSMDKKENDAQVTTFLSKHKDMKRFFEKQLFPSMYDSDGFYIAKLVKE